ncbi:MAG: preprotein translocase subunit SecE [Candidatus Woesebacteria bacterium]|nr:MAG: preprotein translocase subunit SecE [Candidatus Woesebacteria bacterium]
MKQIFNFFSEVKIELSKVTWPKRDDVIKLTLIVFAVSAIIGAYVGGLDFLFTKLLALIVTK